MAEKKAPNVIPVAQRIINFKEEDFRRSFLPADIFKTENDWEEQAKNALVIMDGWNILQYAEEYPIVKYQCDENASCYLGPDFLLNSFIKSIMVSTALCGKRISVGDGKVTTEKDNCNTVVYYEDHAGIRHSIIQNDIYHFLLRKPKLVVSSEGMLVFFTEKQILATLDCNHYHWINDYAIKVGDSTIKDIEVFDGFCKVTLEDKDRTVHGFSLKFKFDAVKHQMILPQATALNVAI